MKTSVPIKNIVITVLVLGVLSLASASFACWGSGMGHHGTATGNSSANLTAEQQQQLDTVKAKYADQLNELQATLNSKSQEYRSARAKDSTTIGELKKLETEIVDLEQQYRTLLDKANAEAGDLIGRGNGPWFNCDHQNHRGMMGQRYHMDSGHMMDHMAGYRGNCWHN